MNSYFGVDLITKRLKESVKEMVLNNYLQGDNSLRIIQGNVKVMEDLNLFSRQLELCLQQREDLTGYDKVVFSFDVKDGIITFGVTVSKKEE